MKRYTTILRMLPALGVLSLLLLAGTARAQIGSGWTLTNFTERLEYESNDVLMTISPPPASFNNGYCEYDNTGGVETFQLLSTHSNRAEIRPNDDYSGGSRQFEADVLISKPSNGECIHQVFNGSTGPYLLLREYSTNNAELYAGGTLPSGDHGGYIATNLYGTWFRLNSINSLTDGNTHVYINGVLVWSGVNPGGTFYTKYGCYGTLGAATAETQFKNVKLFDGGNTNAAPVAAPAFSPGGGTYTNTQTVTISTSTEYASINYTTDGSTPSETHGTLYTGPVSITNTVTLKAIGFETGYLDSGVTSATYTINLPTAASPTFSPLGGTYTSAQSVTISTTTGGGSLRYTTDGSTPTETHGTPYATPVNISTNTTLKAIAYKTGYLDSGVAIATYIINIPSGLPTGWTNTDIGAVGFAGSASYSSGVFSVTGSGTDIWGTNDQFTYAYQLVTNDFTITARVTGQSGTDVWAKAGVMIRAGTATNAAYVALYITPGSGVSMQCRTATGASAVDLGIQTNSQAPYWVSLTRSGNAFAAYSSPDGTNWTLINTTNLTLAAGVCAGLAVCAHENTALDTAIFDDFGLDTPAQYAIPFSAVTASSTYESYSPSNTVDGNLNTRWTSSGTNQWIQYDLGSTQLVSQVQLAFYDGNSRLYNFVIQAGNASVGPWTTLLNHQTNSGTTTNLEVYDFPATFARYVHIVCNTGNHDNYNNITEAEVWGY